MKFLKSLFSILLLTAFLGSTSGISIYKHYCGDFLEAVSLYVQSNPCADEGGEDACSKGKMTSCCDDETEYYQLDIDLIKHNSQQTKVYAVIPIIFSKQNQLTTKTVEQEVILPEFESPPQQKNPIHIRLNRLTLYG